VPKSEERDLTQTLVLSESMHLALPKNHALASKQVVPLSELCETEWLCGSRPSSCGEVVIAACRNAGFEPRIGFESDDYNVMQGYIAAGLGVTLLPDLALANLRSDVVVRPTDPPAPERRVWAVSRSEGARSPATGEMVSILVEVGAAFEKRTGELTLVA
jgi:DNA-binding transcriptional LysR family regulator